MSYLLLFFVKEFSNMEFSNMFILKGSHPTVFRILVDAPLHLVLVVIFGYLVKGVFVSIMVMYPRLTKIQAQTKVNYKQIYAVPGI